MSKNTLKGIIGEQEMKTAILNTNCCLRWSLNYFLSKRLNPVGSWGELIDGKFNNSDENA